jgi:hypothetical protein
VWCGVQCQKKRYKTDGLKRGIIKGSSNGEYPTVQVNQNANVYCKIEVKFKMLRFACIKLLAIDSKSEEMVHFLLINLIASMRAKTLFSYSR